MSRRASASSQGAANLSAAVPPPQPPSHGSRERRPSLSCAFPPRPAGPNARRPLPSPRAHCNAARLSLCSPRAECGLRPAAHTAKPAPAETLSLRCARHGYHPAEAACDQMAWLPTSLVLGNAGSDAVDPYAPDEDDRARWCVRGCMVYLIRVTRVYSFEKEKRVTAPRYV